MNHYVYLIEQKNALVGEPKQYIGVRSCEGNIGEDKYMSSSKYVKEAIKKNGIEQFNKIILKRFNSRKEAMDYEIELHEQFNVTGSNFFFNKAKQKTDSFSCGPGELNPFYGRKHTEEYKKRMSALLKTKDCRQKVNNLGKKFPQSGPKIRASILKRIEEGTWKPPYSGKKSEEHIKNHRESLLRNNKRLTCNHCGKISVPGNIVRWHNDNCKFKE
jgi:hypothetical protein